MNQAEHHFWKSWGRRVRAHRPVTDTETAWAGMEVLLDREPRRAPAFYWPLLGIGLIVAGLLWPDQNLRPGHFPIVPVRVETAPEQAAPVAGMAAPEAPVAGIARRRPVPAKLNKLSIATAVVQPERSPADRYTEVQTAPAGNIMPVSGKDPQLLPEIERDFPEISVVSATAPGRLYAGIAAGVTGMLTDPARLQTALVPVAGLFAGYRFRPGWALEAGLQYRVNSGQDIRWEYRENLGNILGYDYVNVVSRGLTAYRSVDIPLTVSGRVGEDWSLRAGIRYSLLSEYRSYESRNKSAAVIAPAKNIVDSDFGLVFGATRALSDRWQVDLRYSHGLRDISPDHIYRDSRVHRHAGLELAVRYRITLPPF